MSSSNSKVRVRFAPSPTGYLHVGGVRTFLFNWLYAKKHQGTMVLRIEDTDQERSTQENTDMLLEDIKKLGFEYAEGVMPDGSEVGPHGPYYQSKRIKIYLEHVQKLLDQNLAYYAFDSEEEIQQKRELAIKLGKQPEYDGAKLSQVEALERIKNGESAVVRFRAPKKAVKIFDHLRGEIEFKEGTVDDFVLTRSPKEDEKHLGTIGMPTYNFCCVIDDYLMEISHAMRGEDHLSNTVKQQIIYEAFSWKPPVFVHIAMVLGADKQKLSKRNGDASVRDYLKKGYLEETLMNFLALLGWWPKDLTPASGHPEVISLAELVENFDFDGLQKSPGVFDVQKLQWMNGFYLRQKPLEEVADLARPYFEKSEHFSIEELDRRKWYLDVVDLFRTEVSLLSELPEVADQFLHHEFKLHEEAMEVITKPEFPQVLEHFEAVLHEFPTDLKEDDFMKIAELVAEKMQAKAKKLFMFFRVSMTGKKHGPELKKILPLLGKSEIFHRLSVMKKQLGS